MKLFFDFQPALDPHPSGIAQMTMGIAGALAARLPPEDILFFTEGRLLPRAFVEHVLARPDGSGLAPWKEGRVICGQMERALDKYSNACKVGFFTNIKRVRGIFDLEVSVVADLVYMLYPQFLYPEAVHYYASQILRDLVTSDLVLPISDATHADCASFFTQYMGRCETLHLGCDQPFRDEVEADPAVEARFGPYLLALGTREPRKNLDLLFAALDRRPEAFEGVSLVIVGKQGWGDQNATSIPQNVHILDYVSAAEKRALLRGARALLYPSIYEGFGIPIAEANRLGIPVVCSVGGSCPEVADPATTQYFDPTDIDGFCDAVERSLSAPMDEPAAVALSRRTAHWDWRLYADRALALIDETAARKSRGGSRDQLALLDRMMMT